MRMHIMQISVRRSSHAFLLVVDDADLGVPGIVFRDSAHSDLKQKYRG
jgi:hypothetical protein